MRGAGDSEAIGGEPVWGQSGAAAGSASSLAGALATMKPSSAGSPPSAVSVALALVSAARGSKASGDSEAEL